MVTGVENRSTSTTLALIDEHLNDWTDLAGEDINVPVAYQEANTAEEWQQDFWAYRGQAAMCKTRDSSKIVRVRIGDGSISDRTIYKQEITDPTNPAQWTAWTQLYTGDHYAVAVESTTGSTFRVIHAKSDGIYVNNVLKKAVVNVVRIKPVTFWAGAIYYQAAVHDTDGERKLDWYFCADISAPTAGNTIEEAANYRWYRSDIGSIVHTDSGIDTIYCMRALAETQARNKYASQTLLTTSKLRAGDTSHVVWETADYIKGPSGQAGYRIMENLYLNKSGATDGTDSLVFYWACWTEEHRTTGGESLSNLQNPAFWMRSWHNPNDWSEPVPVGYSIWGLAGLVEFGNFAYLVGNGRVLQRSTVATSTDLSDYVIEGNYDLPRDSQPGTGSITLANPDNTIGTILGLIGTSEAGLTQQKVSLQIGLKRELDSAWTWKADSPWWITQLSKTKDGDTEHVSMVLGDFRGRMDTEFHDPIVIPGKLEWNDWGVGTPNKAFNYTNADHEFYAAVADALTGRYDLLTTGGDTLFTGWRGENGFTQMHFSTSTGRVLFRYQDAHNFYSAEYNGTMMKVYQTLNDSKVQLAQASVAATASFYIGVDFRWNRIKVYYNFNQVIDTRIVIPAVLVGFVGFGQLPGTTLVPFRTDYFSLVEWNRRLTTIELLTKLLTYCESFIWTYALGLDETTAPELFAPQINMLWGPQSDLDTPGKAFDALLQAGKLEARWSPTSGRIELGRFEWTEDDIEFTIENEIISQEHTNDGAARPNVVSVDGQVNSWTEYDRTDLLGRQRPITHYLDLPELNTPGDVKARAEREVLDARRFNSPGGQAVWFPWFNRLDPYYWIDEQGNKFRTRLEGMSVEWNQSMEPKQNAHLDMGNLIFCPPTAVPATYIARDVFQRTVSSGWSNAQIGGNWVVT